MNRIFTVLSAVVFSATLLAQAPQKFSYQAVIRNANNELVVNKQVGIKISLLQTSESGTAVYVETHTPTSNANGLVSISIGGGTKDPSSAAFTSVDWANGPYFLKTETDPAGGTSYSLTTTSQLLSVPYALYAGNALPSGGTDGQTLTICDGTPTWTTNGTCPGKITALDCNSANNNGTLTLDETANNSVISIISYTGGNGGPYSSQSISSTGVTGLTANLSTGTFANGNGSITYTITGTPSSSGTANFEINIGGKSCILKRTVNSSPPHPTSGFGPDITDLDGNNYKTVYIGTQHWLAENLKVSKYTDGTAIPNITDNTQWTNLTSGAWVYYNNDAANNGKYGKLYNWYALNPTSNGNKNICPVGWHVPTDNEWRDLENYLGATPGSKMKEVGTSNWNSPNIDATNISLFTGLPGGYRNSTGSFEHIGGMGFWWSTTEYNLNAIFRYLESNSGNSSIGTLNKINGVSIRCLKN